MVTHESNNIFCDLFPGISSSVQTAATVGETLPPHWHERMEIWAVQQGEMTVSCDGDIFDICPGDVLIINPGQVHSCRMTAAPAKFNCLIFDTNILLTTRPGEIDQALRNIGSGVTRFQHIVRSNPEVFPLVKKITECHPVNPFSNMEAVGLLYQLLAILTRQYVLKGDHPVPRHLQEINQLLEYIQKNYNKDLTLDLLSTIACRSPSYLCRWFKEAVGDSPMAYLTTIRINKAYELLSTEGCSVAAAAEAVGFSDLNTFTRQFRKRVGVQPSKVKTKQS